MRERLYNVLDGDDALAAWFGRVMTVLIIAVAIGCVHLIMGQCIHIYMGFRDGAGVDALLDVVPWWIVFGGIAALALAGTPIVLILGVLSLICTQGRHEGTFFKKLFGGIKHLLGQHTQNLVTGKLIVRNIRILGNLNVLIKIRYLVEKAA